MGQEFPSPDSSEDEWKHFFVRCSTVPVIILAVGFFLTLLTLCSSCCCLRARSHRALRAPKRAPSFCLGLLIAVLVVSGGFLYWQTGLKALHTAQKEISRASHDVTVASTEGSKMKDVGAAMLQNLEGIPLTCPAGTQQQVKQYVDNISNKVKTFNQQVAEYDKLVQPLPAKVKDVKDKGVALAALTALGLLAPLALVLVACLTVMSAVMCSCTGRCSGCCLRSLGPVLMAPSVLVVTVFAAVQLELGIVSSSFCADVDTNALAFIGRLAGEHSTEYELSQYYITGQGNNSLLQDLSAASKQLQAADASISTYGPQVEALCSWRGLSQLKSGTSDAQSALDLGSQLLSEQNVYPYYDEAIRQDVCKTMIIGLGWLVVFQVAVGLLLPILVCVGGRYLQAKRGWYLDQEALIPRGQV